MPLDAQKLLFHLARRAGTAAPLRWYPTAAENKLFERLDVSGAPTAQAVYANVVQSRFRPHLLPAETSICLESFADELVPCAGDSYRLRCSVSGSRLMKRLVVPAAVRAVMHELLRDVLRVLHRAGICCWAAGGTLLGAVRHGGIIPWDDDVDIGIANEDEARLRAAFGYPCADSTGSRLSEGCSPARMSDCGDSHELVLEYVPLFGYKVYSRALPPPVPPTPLSSGHTPCLRYGYFVDIFLMKECEGRFMLAREAARRTWPDEWWQSDELLPLLRKPFTDIVNDAHEGGSSTTVQLPVGRYPLPHLNRLYGDTCMQEAVVPRQLHGRTLSHPLYIPMELF